MADRIVDVKDLFLLFCNQYQEKLNESELMTLFSKVGRRCWSSDGCDGGQDMKRSERMGGFTREGRWGVIV